MRAVNDRIYILKAIVPEKTKGGVIIPDGSTADVKVKLNIGKVLSVGPGSKLIDGTYIKPQCKVGDVIQWEQFGDIEAGVSGMERVVVVRWEDVIGILDDKDYDGWIFEKK